MGEASTHASRLREAALEAVIREPAAAVSFGVVLAAEGVTTVTLDGHGLLRRYFPDGITEPLA